MSTNQNSLYALLGSKTRADLITLLVMHPGESFYLRQIAGLLEQSTTPVVRELEKLTEIGFVASETKAHAKYFFANPHSPLYPELESLVLKTAGLGERLRAYLKPFPQILFAFIYGSFAAKKGGPKSDVDLFLLGQAPPMVLAKAMRAAEAKLGREIQYSLFDRNEFLKKMKEGNDFLLQVLKGPKIMILGELREFKRFAKTGVD